jgi:hypothetical protein
VSPAGGGFPSGMDISLRSHSIFLCSPGWRWIPFSHASPGHSCSHCISSKVDRNGVRMSCLSSRGPHSKAWAQVTLSTFQMYIGPGLASPGNPPSPHPPWTELNPATSEPHLFPANGSWSVGSEVLLKHISQVGLPLINLFYVSAFLPWTQVV